MAFLRDQKNYIIFFIFFQPYQYNFTFTTLTHTLSVQHAHTFKRRIFKKKFCMPSTFYFSRFLLLVIVAGVAMCSYRFHKSFSHTFATQQTITKPLPSHATSSDAFVAHEKQSNGWKVKSGQTYGRTDLLTGISIDNRTYYIYIVNTR